MEIGRTMLIRHLDAQASSHDDEWAAAALKHIRDIESQLSQAREEAEAAKEDSRALSILVGHKEDVYNIMLSQVEALTVEAERLRGMVPAIVGATLAYACSLLDHGVDPRKEEMPKMLDDITKCMAEIMAPSPVDQGQQAADQQEQAGTPRSET